MPRYFGPGNQYACRPQPSAAELAALRQQIRDLMAKMNWTDGDVDEQLGFAPHGRYTRKVLAGTEKPSANYRARWAQLREMAARGEVQPKPPGAPALVYDPEQAAVSLRQVVAAARQCVECVAEQAEGHRQESDTWWWFGHPRARVCPDHRAAYRRRRAWFARCLELSCAHAVPGVHVPRDGVPAPPAGMAAQCRSREAVREEANH